MYLDGEGLLGPSPRYRKNHSVVFHYEGCLSGEASFEIRKRETNYPFVYRIIQSPGGVLQCL